MPAFLYNYMKIVLATPLYPPDIGGPAKYAHALRQEFIKQGASVRVVAYSSLERLLPLGVRHVVYALRLLPRVLRADAVLALDTWSVGLPALVVAKICRTKLLVRIGGDFLWESYVERTKQLIKLSQFYSAPRWLSFKERLIQRGTHLLLRHTDALLFTTHWQRDLWQRAYRFPQERAHIVENLYPPVQTVSLATHKVFVAAGRDIVLKNMPLLHAAFAEVKKTHSDIELDTRTLSAAEHAERIAQCYAVIVPSVSEVNPNSAIEALAAGKPFICTADSGIVERLGSVGIFIDTQNKEALVAAITELLDAGRYTRAQETLRQFSYTHSWADMAQEILAIAKKI